MMILLDPPAHGCGESNADVRLPAPVAFAKPNAL